MRYIEAPEEFLDYHKKGINSVFLAGGITDCPDWQQEMCGLLNDTDLVVVNPRQADFPIGNPAAAGLQIGWEHRQLRRVERILFWFPKETLCPIALYELGAWSMTKKRLAIGVEPGYAREEDIRIQTSLVRPDVYVVSSLVALAEAIR